MLHKTDLLSRLAEGHAARITVVTPNTRLSQALVADFDAYQVGRGKTVWEAADILPFGAFVERLYEDALYSDIPGELPLLLTPAQEHAIWADAVRASTRVLLSTEETAADCARAWRMLHEWRIGADGKLSSGNEDVQAFHEWAATYRRRTAGEIDAARLPDFLVPLLSQLRRPKLLVAYAFDLVKPQVRDFLDALAAQGVEVTDCKPAPRSASPSRAAFSSAKEELEAAAAWARARLEDRGQLPNSGNSVAVPDLPDLRRIGVVIPDLQLRRREVVRVFSRTMRPAYNLPGAAKEAMPFNVSIGMPLVQYPVVALALTLIRFSRDELSFEDASALMRSPFLGGAEGELAARTQAEVYLRRKLDATVTLPKLISLLQKSSLREKLESLFAVARDDLLAPQTPPEWARHFSALLEAVGFPGERTLDSEEFQARAKLNEMLGELSKLERVAPRMSFHNALNALRRLCAQTLFQPESPDAPIQVLGILESAGLEFDHLWVAGLTDEAWPLQARPSPFIPVAMQRKAGIPEASAEGSLALDRRITDGWRSAASEVIFSFHEKQEDRSLAPSPLIADLPPASVDIPAYPRFRDAIFSSRKLSSMEDRVAPPVTATKIKGGTRVLADQAACPFRAFARHRLGAEALEPPFEGLNAKERGILLHSMMSLLWQELKGSAALAADVSAAISRAAAGAVKDMKKLEGRFAELERGRLVQIAGEWLAIEKLRKPFEVVAVEDARPIQAGPLEISARIDRLDRLGEGGYALLDYKGGPASRQRWLGRRPEEPQLPAYAVNAKEEVRAVAFASLRRGKNMRFIGYSEEKSLLPRVEKYDEKPWSALLKEWKAEIDDLGGQFASGEARVDPKRGLQTCRNCDLHTLCRVFEKVNPLKEEEGADGEGTVS